MENKPKKKNHYVNKKTLYEEMVKFRDKTNLAKEAGRPLPQIPRYVGECFLMICNKLSTKPNFMGYSYRDDMIADAIENCVIAAHSFDPDKSSNPFAYFTQIAWNAFIRRIQKEKKQTYIKHKNYENTIMSNEQWSDNENIYLKANEYSAEIVRSFEDKNNKLTKVKPKVKMVGVEKFSEE